jgi:lysophospholipase L1-like esterase
MKKLRFIFVSFFFAVGYLTCLPVGELSSIAQTAAAYPDPSRFENAIKAFEEESKEAPPPEGAIVGIGSSSMLMWTSIHEDLEPLTVIHRGFGGSIMNDAYYYADRIVIPYKPRAVLLYEGDNDAAFGISPEKIIEMFDAFVKKIHEALPETRIYVISIKPSISRWNIWDAMKKANALLKARCETNPLLTYVDVATPMLGEKGEPLPDIFIQDNLHLNEKGYDIWSEAIRSVLIRKESEFER